MEGQNDGKADRYRLTISDLSRRHYNSEWECKIMKNKIPIACRPPITNDLLLWSILIFAIASIGVALIEMFR